ncbi:hypothetical protein CRE_24233 [Caenorhabditis remanei]|uniref:Uncharacterized protein n=1 Tax=Caenorhabditis remanei TaxID=31234 RepID=E3NCY7_CAERE|nr:hypothetical protein CRE_24233 [Caenorhabditis remanei]
MENRLPIENLFSQKQSWPILNGLLAQHQLTPPVPADFSLTQGVAPTRKRPTDQVLGNDLLSLITANGATEFSQLVGSQPIPELVVPFIPPGVQTQPVISSSYHDLLGKDVPNVTPIQRDALKIILQMNDSFVSNVENKLKEINVSESDFEAYVDHVTGQTNLPSKTFVTWSATQKEVIEAIRMQMVKNRNIIEKLCEGYDIPKQTLIAFIKEQCEYMEQEKMREMLQGQVTGSVLPIGQ